MTQCIIMPAHSLRLPLANVTWMQGEIRTVRVSNWIRSECLSRMRTIQSHKLLTSHFTCKYHDIAKENTAHALNQKKSCPIVNHSQADTFHVGRQTMTNPTIRTWLLHPLPPPCLLSAHCFRLLAGCWKSPFCCAPPLIVGSNRQDWGRLLQDPHSQE